MGLSRHAWRRVLALVVVLALVAGLAASPSVHAWMQVVLERTNAAVETYPRTGVLVFVVASALSAMLAFFSTAVVVPIAVHAWGPAWTTALLWISWLIGGCCAYAIGRTLGLRVVAWFVSAQRVESYASRLSARAGFVTILLFQLALPSEVPGYVLGVLRYRFRIYLTALALALAELPYAIGTVVLGHRFVHGGWLSLMLVGLAGVVLVALAYHLLHHRIGAPPPETGREAVDARARGEAQASSSRPGDEGMRMWRSPRRSAG